MPHTVNTSDMTPPTTIDASPPVRALPIPKAVPVFVDLPEYPPPSHPPRTNTHEDGLQTIYPCSEGSSSAGERYPPSRQASRSGPPIYDDTPDLSIADATTLPSVTSTSPETLRRDSASLSLPPAYELPHETLEAARGSTALDGRRDGEEEVEGGVESLPKYEETVVGEPQTLARTFWLWGWVFFPSWVIGMFILWIEPIQDEQETDPAKRQREAEKTAIIRVTEKKYAKRCLWSLVGFAVLLAIIVGLAILARKLA